MDTVSNLISDIILELVDASRGDFLADISSSFSSWEALIAAFFIFAVFFYGLSIGKGRLLIFLVSIYIAKLLVDSFVYVDYLVGVFGDRIFSIYLGLFIISYIFVFVILDRSVLKIRLSTKEFPIGRIMILSVMIIILLANVVFTYLPSDIAVGIRGGTARYLIGDTAFFWWFLLSLLSILLLKRRKREIHD